MPHSESEEDDYLQKRFTFTKHHEYLAFSWPEIEWDCEEPPELPTDTLILILQQALIMMQLKDGEKWVQQLHLVSKQFSQMLKSAPFVLFLEKIREWWQISHDNAKSCLFDHFFQNRDFALPEWDCCGGWKGAYGEPKLPFNDQHFLFGSELYWELDRYYFPFYRRINAFFANDLLCAATYSFSQSGGCFFIRRVPMEVSNRLRRATSCTLKFQNAPDAIDPTLGSDRADEKDNAPSSTEKKRAKIELSSDSEHFSEQLSDSDSEQWAISLGSDFDDDLSWDSPALELFWHMFFCFTMDQVHFSHNLEPGLSNVINSRKVGEKIIRIFKSCFPDQNKFSYLADDNRSERLCAEFLLAETPNFFMGLCIFVGYE